LTRGYSQRDIVHTPDAQSAVRMQGSFVVPLWQIPSLFPPV
jgi:hypothetical protein